MFRIVCYPSSGNIELYLTEIRSGSLMFVVCLIGVWQRNFELGVCVNGPSAASDSLAALESVSVEDFRQCFQHWERCWDCCIQSQGEYFEED